MKLVRFGNAGKERPGIWLEADEQQPARIVDVQASVFDIADYDSRFWQTWGLERLHGLLKEPNLKIIPAEEVRLGPPVARPGQIIALGKNYRDHAMEFDSTIPARPVFFSKSPGSLCGPTDSIYLVPGMARVDGEVELALVIGKRARFILEDEAFDHVAGYTILNDVTDRELQAVHGQWFLGKSADSFGPMGPFLVTRDEIPDPHQLTITQRVNGHTLQEANTSEMIFRINMVLSALSQVMTLEPGDVVSMGTPGGIGSARKPPMVLHEGDVVECEIEALGKLQNRVERRYV